MPSLRSPTSKPTTTGTGIGQSGNKQTLRRADQHKNSTTTNTIQQTSKMNTNNTNSDSSQYSLHTTNPSSTVSFTPTAPAPDLQQRTLIFDSLFTVNDLTYMSNPSNSNKQPSIQRYKSIAGNDSVGSTFVYTFGAGHYSQLGRKVTMKLQSPTLTGGQSQHHAERGSIGSRSSTSNSIPTVLSSLPGITIKAVACGHNHTALVSDSGQLYTFGKLELFSEAWLLNTGMWG